MLHAIRRQRLQAFDVINSHIITLAVNTAIQRNIIWPVTLPMDLFDAGMEILWQSRYRPNTYGLPPLVRVNYPPANGIRVHRAAEVAQQLLTPPHTPPPSVTTVLQDFKAHGSFGATTTTSGTNSTTVVAQAGSLAQNSDVSEDPTTQATLAGQTSFAQIFLVKPE